MKKHMPAFKSFELTEKSDNVAKRSVIIARWSRKKGNKWLAVEFNSGWPSDKPEVVHCERISCELRARIKGWIGLINKDLPC